MYFVEGSIHDLSSPAVPHVCDTLSLLGKHERSAFLQLGSDVPNMEELNQDPYCCRWKMFEVCFCLCGNECKCKDVGLNMINWPLLTAYSAFAVLPLVLFSVKSFHTFISPTLFM